MHIINGEFPTEKKKWHAAVLLNPHDSLGKIWFLGKTLADVNKGGLIALIVLTDENETTVRAARKLETAVRQLTDNDAQCYPLIITIRPHSNDLRDIVKRAAIDLLLTNAANASQHNLNNLHCGVAVMRGDHTDRIDDNPDNDDNHVTSILIPTSGGPNTVYSFDNLLNLTKRDVKLTALYIASSHLGEHEVALGHARLKKTLAYIDAEERIETKLLVTDSVIDGIVTEASSAKAGSSEAGSAYDLVIIGASKESSIDKFLFGDIPGAVVRQSKKPVMVIQQGKGHFGDLAERATWVWQRIIPRLDVERRNEAYVRIRRGARPTHGFYLLITLATLIAALGLLADSGETIIGAMLVAPLMAPIVGAGLAAVMGDARFMRLSLGAVLRGTLISVAMGMLVGLFFIGKPLTNEILIRTHPSLLDLAIALFSGLAGAYAVANYSSMASALPGVSIAVALMPPLAVVGITFVTGNFRESLGAALLFFTNFIAISSATAVVLLSLGFRPASTEKARRNIQANSARIAFLLLVIIAGLLIYTTYALTRESLAVTNINTIAKEAVADVVKGTIVGDPEIEGEILSDEPLAIDLVIRTAENLQHRHVAKIQEEIAIQLQREVALTVQLIRVEKLDSFEPPTQTPTPTFTPMATSTSTATSTPTFTPTATATFTPTPSATPTLTPTLTATATPTLTPSPTWTPTISATMMISETAVPTASP